MADTNNTERAAFEALPEFVADPLLLQRGLDGEHYIYKRVQGMWEGWKARASMAAEAEPVAYRISALEEPGLGHWLSEEKGGAWCLSEPLYAAPQPNAALADGWISVDDRYPPACHELIVFGRKYGERAPGKRVYVTYVGSRPRETVDDEEITHWMLMPDRPAPPTLNASKEGNGHG